MASSGVGWTYFLWLSCWYWCLEKNQTLRQDINLSGKDQSMSQDINISVKYQTINLGARFMSISRFQIRDKYWIYEWITIISQKKKQ